MGRAQGGAHLQTAAGMREENSTGRCFRDQALYHATPPSNIEIIQVEGLNPNSYLWSDGDLAHEFSQEYLPRGYAMFEVNTDALMRPDEGFGEFSEGIEAWYSPQAIPSQCLQLAGVFGVDDSEEWDEE